LTPQAVIAYQALGEGTDIRCAQKNGFVQ